MSRGFHGRRRDAGAAPGRVPPGQYVTEDFPVLSAGPTPHIALPEWSFSVRQGGAELRSWTWAELQALPAEEISADIHCVTRWSKLGTSWRGVPVEALLAAAGREAAYLLAFCDGGYTTNLPAHDVSGGRAWLAFEYDGEPLELGCAAWNCSTPTSRGSGRPTAITCTGTHGANSGTRATDLAGRDRHRGQGRDGGRQDDRARRA
ncbi:MAG: molybdopterin-dependent oxidoreductase [Streptosporangiaceae bacterium]